MGKSQTLFLYLLFFSKVSMQLIVNKICLWLDSNVRSVVSERTALPTEPQLLHISFLTYSLSQNRIRINDGKPIDKHLDNVFWVWVYRYLRNCRDFWTWFTRGFWGGGGSVLVSLHVGLIIFYISGSFGRIQCGKESTFFCKWMVSKIFSTKNMLSKCNSHCQMPNWKHLPRKLNYRYVGENVKGELR